MKKRNPDADILQPESMEDRARYLSRFESNGPMRDLFNDPAQRRQIAAQVFWDRWQEASATVTKEDGTQFFID